MVIQLRHYFIDYHSEASRDFEVDSHFSHHKLEECTLTINELANFIFLPILNMALHFPIKYFFHLLMAEEYIVEVELVLNVGLYKFRIKLQLIEKKFLFFLDEKLFFSDSHGFKLTLIQTTPARNSSMNIVLEQIMKR